MIETAELKLEDNYGVLQFSLPDSLFENIKKKVKVLQETKLSDKQLFFNNSLAGQIENELKFHPDMEFRTFLENLEKKYTKHFNYDKDTTIKLESCWINFQKKHEYNPYHNHSGALSFVIWVQIPYSLDDEDNMPNTKNANTKENGRFCMTYNSNFNGIKRLKIDLDKTYEGKGIIFPAKAFHYVNPFYTSDNFRISISGNFYNAPT